MKPLTDFSSKALDNGETRALRELLKFLERPHSIGIDNLKENLRNAITLMLAIKGYETGFDLQHLLYGEHSSLAPEGILKTDKKKKQDIKDFWDLIAEIEREMSLYFRDLFANTIQEIIIIKHVVSEEIAEIDAVIEEKEIAIEQADTRAEKILLEKEIVEKKKKRSELKAFKKHIKEQEEQLQEASVPEEVIGIQKNVIESHEDLKAGNFDPNKDFSNPLDILGDVLEERRDSTFPTYSNFTYDDIYGEMPVSRIVDDYTEYTTNNNDEDSGKDEGGKDEDTKPDLGLNM